MLVLFLQHEIEKSLPSGGSSGQSANPVIQELKKMMEEVEGIKAEREVIESELKESNFDMGMNILAGLCVDHVCLSLSVSLSVLSVCLSVCLSCQSRF